MKYCIFGHKKVLNIGLFRVVFIDISFVLINVKLRESLVNSDEFDIQLNSNFINTTLQRGKILNSQ